MSEIHQIKTQLHEPQGETTVNGLSENPVT